jgi:hypothetical protein
VSRRPARSTAALGLLLSVLAAFGAVACSDGGSNTPTAKEQAASTPAPPAGGAPTAGRAAQTTPAAPTAPTAPRDLPRGGRTVLPSHRVVAFYGEGYPGGIGLLNVNDLDGVAGRIEQQASAYTRYGRPVLPAMELIVTNAVRRAGPDGSYSLKLDDATIDRYLAAARKHRMLLILDFQPGLDQFLPQVKRYEKYLTQPDVAVGLDPEWRTPGSRPYAGTGHSSAAEINAVESYLTGLVRLHKLPQKLFVVHQFTAQMVPDRQRVGVPKELSVVFHMDGVGPPGLKIGGYNALKMSGPFRNGFKVFPVLDKPSMSPSQVMTLRPQPEVVTYQ